MSDPQIPLDDPHAPELEPQPQTTTAVLEREQVEEQLQEPGDHERFAHYVRKEKIPRVWPLFASAAGREDNIRKFEEIGTHPQANFNAVSVALTFHRGIGADRKIARLRYLRDRWAKALLAHSERVKVLTELGPDKAGAICLFSVDGMDPVKLGGWLMREYRIVNTPIVHPEFSGIRITPNVYTTVDEIDVFTEAVKRALKQGIA